MNNFSSKLNLYEYLSMLVPGSMIEFIIVYQYCFCGCWCHCDSYFEKIGLNNTSIKVVVFLIFAYIIGIIWNTLMELLFSGLRDNARMIQYAEDVCQKPFLCIMMISSLCVPCKTLCSLLISTCPKSIDIIKNYDKQYYEVMFNSFGDSVICVERQIALLRNVVIPFPILCAILLDFSCCWSVVAGVVIYFIIILKQMKVYKLVIERSRYLKDNQNNVKKTQVK